MKLFYESVKVERHLSASSSMRTLRSQIAGRIIAGVVRCRRGSKREGRQAWKTPTVNGAARRPDQTTSAKWPGRQVGDRGDRSALTTRSTRSRDTARGTCEDECFGARVIAAGTS